MFKQIKRGKKIFYSRFRLYIKMTLSRYGLFANSFHLLLEKKHEKYYIKITNQSQDITVKH